MLPHWRGGGILNLTGSPTVNDCRFIANSAGAGGGMNNAFDSSPNVTNCTFSGNRATPYAGGGMTNANDSNPTVANCTFSGNSTLDDACRRRYSLSLADALAVPLRPFSTEGGGWYWVD